VEKIYSLVSIIAIAAGLLTATPSVVNAVVNASLMVHDFSGPGITPNNLGKWTGITSTDGLADFSIVNGAGRLSWSGATYLGWATNLADTGDANYEIITYDSLSFWVKLEAPSSEIFKVYIDTGINKVDINVISTAWAKYTIPLSSFCGGSQPFTAGSINFDGFDSNGTILYDDIQLNPVPEPSTLLLAGPGLMSLFGFIRKRKIN
jgi:hypothetical protein